MISRLTAFESQFKAQFEEMRTLGAENEEFKADKAKQEERNDKLESGVDELEAKSEEHTTMITMASDEIISLKAYIAELESKTLSTSPSPPQAPSTLTNVPNPSATPLPVPPSTPTPPPPTSLALCRRFAFLLVGSAEPGFLMNYAIRVDKWYVIFGGASFTTSSGAM